MIEAACCAQSLILAEVLDTQLGPATGNGVDKGLEDGFLIVADNENFFNLGDGCYSAKAVFDDGVAGDREQRLLGLTLLGVFFL